MEVLDSKSKVLLFDLGGVLVDWHGVAALAELSDGRMTVEDSRQFWLSSRWVRELERGRCEPDAFAQGVIDDLGLHLTPEAFKTAFISWDRGPLPGALELLDTLRPHYVLACLTNNNKLHWQNALVKAGLPPRFHKCFVSYQMGLMKPDRAIFEHVLSDLGCEAHEIVFFDDNPECVEAARALGFMGHNVRGVAEVRGVLERLDLMP